MYIAIKTWPMNALIFQKVLIKDVMSFRRQSNIKFLKDGLTVKDIYNEF